MGRDELVEEKEEEDAAEEDEQVDGIAFSFAREAQEAGVGEENAPEDEMQRQRKSEEEGETLFFEDPAEGFAEKGEENAAGQREDRCQEAESADEVEQQPRERECGKIVVIEGEENGGEKKTEDQARGLSGIQRGKEEFFGGFGRRLYLALRLGVLQPTPLLC